MFPFLWVTFVVFKKKKKKWILLGESQREVEFICQKSSLIKQCKQWVLSFCTGTIQNDWRRLTLKCPRKQNGSVKCNSRLPAGHPRHCHSAVNSEALKACSKLCSNALTWVPHGCDSRAVLNQWGSPRTRRYHRKGTQQRADESFPGICHYS